MSGGSGGGSGGSKTVKKIVGGVTTGIGAVGSLIGGSVGKTVEKVGGELIRGPGHLVNDVLGQQQPQVVYYDSGGSNSADTTPLYQTSQSTGSDQYERGDSPNSVGSSSILIGKNPGNLFLGKQSLLGKR